MTPLYRAKAGFTLIELMVAATVATLLIIITVGLASQSLTATGRTNATLFTANSAAASIDLLASDLDSLTSTRQPFEFLQTSQGNIADLGSTSSLLLIASPGSESTLASDQAQARAIRYQVLYQDPINPAGTKKTFGLYRTVIPSDKTFTDYLGKADLNPAFNTTPATLDDFLVGNLLDFQIRFYTTDVNSPANEPSGGAIQPVRLSGTGTMINGSAYSGPPLVWAEITLVILKDIDNANTRLETGKLSRAEAIARYGQRFTRRIPIRSTF